MTATPNIGLTQPARGSDVDTWDTPVNGNMAIIDSVLGNTFAVSMSSTDVTLNSSQAQNLYFVVTGTLSGNVNLIFPATARFYVIKNGTTGAFTLTAKTAAGGSTGVTINQGFTDLVVSDGTNIYPANNDLNLPNNSVTNANLAQIATQTIKGRNTAGTGNVEEISISQVLNWLTTTQGSIPYQNGSGWTALGPGTAGQALLSGGPSANPSFGTIVGIPSQTGNANKVLSTDGSTPSFSTNLSVFAWGYFTLSGPTVNKGFNIASISAVSTTTWKVTFTNPAADAHYSICAVSYAPGSFNYVSVTAQTANDFTLSFTNPVGGGGPQNPTGFMVQVFGGF